MDIAAGVFGYTKSDVEEMFEGMTAKQAAERLEIFKKHIRDEFRTLSKVMHPDVGGDHGEFVRLKEAYDNIMNWNILERKRQVRIPVVYWYTTMGSSYTYASTAPSTGPTNM
jgi:hypothetical protein